MVKFDLRLGDTYRSKGFFNVSVDFERYLTTTDGPIDIFLGHATNPVAGRINRTANRNGTPRIFGNKALADFFQTNFQRGCVVAVEIISPGAVRIGAKPEHPRPVAKPGGKPSAPSPKAPALVSADQLGAWRRALIGILNQLEPRPQRIPDEGPAKRIARLSRSGAIPRDVAALMRVVTEMRNMTEYESKVLSASESAVVAGAWAAIRRWADTL